MPSAVLKIVIVVGQNCTKIMSTYQYSAFQQTFDGEMSSYQVQPNYYRYHLVIPKIPRESLSMEDSACCDNNRTPVIF